jgi:hypothetical protein
MIDLDRRAVSRPGTIDAAADGRPWRRTTRLPDPHRPFVRGAGLPPNHRRPLADSTTVAMLGAVGVSLSVASAGGLPAATMVAPPPARCWPSCSGYLPQSGRLFCLAWARRP